MKIFCDDQQYCQAGFSLNDRNDDCDSARSCSERSFVGRIANNQGLEIRALECSLKIEWFNSKEAANFLRLSVKSLRNLTSNGQIPFYKLGRRNRYRKDELESILLSQKRGKHYGN